MAQDCMNIFKNENLEDLAKVEQVFPFYFLLIFFVNHLQSCATGFTSEGKVPKSLVEEMVPLLDSRTVM